MRERASVRASACEPVCKIGSCPNIFICCPNILSITVTCEIYVKLLFKATSDGALAL